MRLYTLVVSIAVHAALLIVLVIVPLAAIGALPGVHIVTDFVRARAAELPDIPPPPGDRAPAASTRETTSTAAPTRAPDRIAVEGPSTPPTLGTPLGDGVGFPNGLPTGTLISDVPVVAPPPPRKPVVPGGDILPPKKIRDVAPVYPPLAVAARKEGTVILEAVIAEDGRVRDVRVLRSIPLLDQAAVDAVRQWRFTPTLLNRQPVPVVMTVTVAFVLTK